MEEAKIIQIINDVVNDSVKLGKFINDPTAPAWARVIAASTYEVVERNPSRFFASLATPEAAAQAANFLVEHSGLFKVLAEKARTASPIGHIVQLADQFAIRDRIPDLAKLACQFADHHAAAAIAAAAVKTGRINEVFYTLAHTASNDHNSALNFVEATGVESLTIPTVHAAIRRCAVASAKAFAFAARSVGSDWNNSTLLSDAMWELYCRAIEDPSGIEALLENAIDFLSSSQLSEVAFSLYLYPLSTLLSLKERWDRADRVRAVKDKILQRGWIEKFPPSAQKTLERIS